FLLLVIAALTSLVSLIEVPVALLVARLRWRRPAAALAVAVGALVALAAVSFRQWRAAKAEVARLEALGPRRRGGGGA
ncbi:MAG: hypothetical protein ACK4ST_14530, partial [Elioraea tepidiphila]